MAESKKEQILNRYQHSHNYYQTIRDNSVDYYKKYRGWLNATTAKDYYKWRSKLFIPAVGRAVDGLLPDLMLTLFGPDPFFNVFQRE